MAYIRKLIEEIDAANKRNDNRVTKISGRNRHVEYVPVWEYVRDAARKYGVKPADVWDMVSDHLGYESGDGAEMTIYEREFMDTVIEGMGYRPVGGR